LSAHTLGFHPSKVRTNSPTGRNTVYASRLDSGSEGRKKRGFQEEGGF